MTIESCKFNPLSYLVVGVSQHSSFIPKGYCLVFIKSLFHYVKLFLLCCKVDFRIFNLDERIVENLLSIIIIYYCNKLIVTRTSCFRVLGIHLTKTNILAGMKNIRNYFRTGVKHQQFDQESQDLT